MKKIAYCKYALLILVLSNFKTFSQNVNQFTGGFSYSTPLMTVPSPYGPGVSIGAGYGAGIGVNQGASQVGLGWDINAGGAISRSVSGVPDDWNGPIVTDAQMLGFKTQGGVMYFKNGTSHENLDFYKSTYKIDTPAFYFPDYDNYSVSGPGIGGSLNPHLFDFATIQLNTGEGSNLPVASYSIAEGQFTKNMQFNFAGDYAGNLKSRHYPETPINGNTIKRLPGDGITDAEYSGGSAVPYVGIGSSAPGPGFNLTDNRLTSSKYVEYFTNNQINDRTANPIGFVNIPSGARSSTDFELDGIGAFRITDASGFVYYYTQPVYINSATFGNYPLNNDYSIKDYNTTDDTLRVQYGTGSNYTGNYYIKDVALTTAMNNRPYIIEWRQTKRYAYNWLLTAVTGPDYDDTDNSETVNSGDKGYWVSYDYQLWTKNYTKRIPEYGFNYSFSADENDNTQDIDVADPLNKKITGKFGSFSKYNQEIYYLNKVQTSSHTAVMVRDIRLDEFCGNTYYDDNQFLNRHNMPSGAGGPDTYTTTNGTLSDDGGKTGNYGINCSSTAILTPSGATSITIKFNTFDMQASDKVEIYSGNNTLLRTYSTAIGQNQNPLIDFPMGETFTNLINSTIKVKEVTDYVNQGLPGFSLGWSSAYNAIVPQLKLNRIVLFTNEDFNTLNTPSGNSAYNVSTAVTGFDISSVGKDKFYNETWYNHTDNKTGIESKSLQTVEFNQDYSLAKNYISNIKTNVWATDKLSSPTEVVNSIFSASGDYSSSGKLTLNEINTYSVGHVKASPSVLFDYNKTVANDNPDYNPVKVDYSGFYKNDASAQGYSSYTTETSSALTDAWSLRKITSPMGGTVEVNYESNEYGKVFDGNGGFRGPSKMYSIKEVALPESYTDYGAKWGYTMEENVTEPEDFTLLRTNPPTGTVKHVNIPFLSPVDLGMKFINSGTFTFSDSPVQMTGIQDLFSSPKEDDHYGHEDDCAIINNNVDLDDLVYTGNGYIHFDLPLDYSVKGGGIRVASIVTKNGASDSYTQEYNYAGGVTPMEMDRFGEEKQRTVTGYVARNLKLRPPVYDHHRMGPGIGYTQVTVKNKGQNNIANGSSTTTFITSDAGIDNFKVRIQQRASTETHCSTGSSSAIDTTHIIEVVDKFSGYFGQVQKVESADINGNIISKTVNEYSNLSQGSIVENYDFVTAHGYTVGAPPYSAICARHDHIICIKREYPVILSKQTVYGPGISATTEYLAFDDITGAPVMTRSTSPNKGTTVSRSSAAFRISQYETMGPKSVLSTNANILGPTAYSKVTVDSTITGSSDFANYSVQTFKKNFSIRKFDATNSKFINDPQTNLYWIADKSYAWAGNYGSIDDYGLFKQSELSTAPFDYTLASIDSKWRFGSENTLLDNSGHILETRAFNNRFSATKYGYGDTLPVSTGGNVNYASFTYCGFESALVDADPGTGVANYIEGEVKMNSGIKLKGTTSIPTHTGTYLVKVSTGTTGPSYSVKYNSGDEYSGLLKGRTYRASVWVHSSSHSDCQLSVSLTGSTTKSVTKTSTSTITIGDWILINIDMTVSSAPSNDDELKVYLESPNGDAYFDDLRLHPVDAGVSATVYEPRTQRVAATLDGNNFATFYKYNAAGQVLEVWQEIEGVGLKRMKKFQYNFARGLN